MERNDDASAVIDMAYGPADPGTSQTSINFTSPALQKLWDSLAYIYLLSTLYEN